MFLRIFIRIAIFYSIVSSLDCIIVIICPQMIIKTLKWLKKSFCDCEFPNEHQCSWARFPELVCHYVNLMLIKMVIGWEFSKVPLTGQVKLPTGLNLEGEELTGKEKKVHWVLPSLEPTHASTCSGLQKAPDTLVSLSQWFMNQGSIRKKKKKEKNKVGGGGGGEGPWHLFPQI